MELELQNVLDISFEYFLYDNLLFFSEQLLSLDVNSIENLYKVARAHVFCGEFKSAYSLLNCLKEKWVEKKDSHRICFLYATICYRLCQYNEAEEFFTKILDSLNSKIPLGIIYYRLAQCHEKMDDFDLAKKYYLKTLKRKYQPLCIKAYLRLCDLGEDMKYQVLKQNLNYSKSFLLYQQNFSNEESKQKEKKTKSKKTADFNFNDSMTDNDVSRISPNKSAGKKRLRSGIPKQNESDFKSPSINSSQNLKDLVTPENQIISGKSFQSRFLDSSLTPSPILTHPNAVPDDMSFQFNSPDDSLTPSPFNLSKEPPKAPKGKKKKFKNSRERILDEDVEMDLNEGSDIFVSPILERSSVKKGRKKKKKPIVNENDNEFEFGDEENEADNEDNSDDEFDEGMEIKPLHKEEKIDGLKIMGLSPQSSDSEESGTKPPPKKKIKRSVVKKKGKRKKKYIKSSMIDEGEEEIDLSEVGKRLKLSKSSSSSEEEYSFLQARRKKKEKNYGKLKQKKKNEDGEIESEDGDIENDDEESKDLFEFRKMYEIIGRGYCHLCHFRFKSCLETFSNLPKNIYKGGWIQCLIAKCYYELGNYMRSKRIFKNVNLNEEYRLEMMDLYSSVLWQLKDDSEIARLTGQMKSIDEDSIYTQVALGNSFSLQNDHVSSLGFFKNAITINPFYSYGYVLAGHEYMEQNQYDNAIQYFQHALKLDDNRNYAASCGLGMIYIMQEKFKTARSCLVDSLSVKTYNPIAWMYLGIVNMKLNRLEESLKNFDTGLSIVPTNDLIRLKRAECLIILKRPKEAIKELEKLRMDNKVEAGVYSALGVAYLMNGEKYKSDVCFSRADNLRKRRVISDENDIQNEGFVGLEFSPHI